MDDSEETWIWIDEQREKELKQGKRNNIKFSTIRIQSNLLQSIHKLYITRPVNRI